MPVLLFALLPIAAAGTVLLTGFLYQQIGMKRDAKRYRPVGQAVVAAGCSFHINKQGQGSPTVVLESGLAGTSLSWKLVAHKVAAFTTVCTYDRAGFGWSTASPSTRLLANVVDELYQVLIAAHCIPPYLLVGHSYGGLVVRAFAHLHPELTAGIILLDPVSTSYWANCSSDETKRLRLGVKLARRGALLARFGVVRFALYLLGSGHHFLPQLVASASARRAPSFLSRLTGQIRKLPPEVWPVIQAQWSRPGGFLSIADYLNLLPTNARLAETSALICRVPLTILSASTATAAELGERDRWAAQSCRGQHTRLAESGHWVQVDQPATVIAAIREMVDFLGNSTDLR